MGLLDLFKPNPTPGLSSEEDTGFSLPHLFNDESRARLGVLGSNLIAAGFGKSPDAGAVLGLGELGDKRKKEKKLQAAAKRYADKIRAKNPDLAEAIDADYTLISTIMGKNIDLENQKAFSKYEYDRDPMNKLYDDIIGNTGAAPEAVVGMANPTGKSDYGAPPPAVAPPEVPQDYAKGPEITSQDAVYRPGVQPVGTEVPAPTGLTYSPQQQKMIQFSKKFHPDYTDAEALRWFPSARNSDHGQAAANQIQSDREYNQTAAATLKAAELKRTQEEADKNKQIAADLYKQEEQARLTAQGKALPGEQFQARVEKVPVVPPNSGQSSPVTAPPMTPEQMHQQRIATDAGLPPELSTPANTRILEAAAAEGPKEYATALEKMTTPKESTMMEQYHQSQEDRKAKGLPALTMDEWKIMMQPKTGMEMTTNPDGTFTFKQGEGVGGDDDGPNLNQAKLMMFGARMETATADLDASLGTLTDLTSSAVSNIPILGNYWKTEEYQLAENSGRFWINAIKRVDSGAAVVGFENMDYWQTFMPVPGDSAKTVKQKMEYRHATVEGMKLGLSIQQAAKVSGVTARDEEGKVVTAAPPDMPKITEKAKAAGITTEMWKHGDKEMWDELKDDPK